MLKLIRRDLMLLFANWQVVIFLLFIPPVLSLIMGVDKINEIMMINIFIIGYFFTTITFSYETRIKPYLLIQSLPVTRVELVVSKYFFTFINFIIGLVYTVGALWIIQYFKILNVDSLDYSYIREVFVLLILSLSISLPGLLILRPRLGNIINTAVYIACLNLFIISPENIDQNLELLNSFAPLIVILYVLSLGISIWLYDRKDLV